MSFCEQRRPRMIDAEFHSIKFCVEQAALQSTLLLAHVPERALFLSNRVERRKALLRSSSLWLYSYKPLLHQIYKMILQIQI